MRNALPKNTLLDHVIHYWPYDCNNNNDIPVCTQVMYNILSILCSVHTQRPATHILFFVHIFAP